jgi:hypothetical protein
LRTSARRDVTPRWVIPARITPVRVTLLDGADGRVENSFLPARG